MTIRAKKGQGFTLVELLIVVAIIGILSTIGIPTFKRMVQKAKKSEAKVALGGVYTTEAAFFSEYGAYGSNVDKLGFELEGSAANRFYSVGFPTTGCGNLAAHKPLIANAFGSAINAAFPAYYNPLPSTGDQRSVLIRANMSNCLQGDVADTGNTFSATASGIIAPGIPFTAPTSSQDLWTINENRQLSNVADGVL